MSGTGVDVLSRQKVQGRIQRDLFQTAEDRLILQQARYWSNRSAGASRAQRGQQSADRPTLHKKAALAVRPLMQAAIVMVTAEMSLLLIFDLIG